MSWLEHAEKWISFSNLGKNLKDQLFEIKKNKDLLEDCFYKHLEFGTGGMRGELGARHKPVEYIYNSQSCGRSCYVHGRTR